MQLGTQAAHSSPSLRTYLLFELLFAPARALSLLQKDN